MGTVNKHRYHIVLKIKHHKKAKLRKLIARLQTADLREREILVKKIQRVAPFSPYAEAASGHK
jgi:hypothetical protein